MRAFDIVKVDPSFSGLEKFSKGAIGFTFSHCQLEGTHKPFCMPIFPKQEVTSIMAFSSFISDKVFIICYTAYDRIPVLVTQRTRCT